MADQQNEQNIVPTPGGIPGVIVEGTAGSERMDGATDNGNVSVYCTCLVFPAAKLFSLIFTE